MRFAAGVVCAWIAFGLFVAQAEAQVGKSAASAPAKAVWRDASLPMERRIDDILRRMTLEEKVRMCFGGTQPGVAQIIGVPRLGIPGMAVSDGPRGVTASGGIEFPAGIGMGATWDPELTYEAGRVIGQEARGAGVSMVFAPAVNINRDPLGGRFFEYMTEDPYLDARLAVGWVKGIQSQDVAATVKHFVANNREENRDWYMSNVSERALREIYFPAFKAAVRQGGAWGVMTAANGINGKLAATNGFLIHDVLDGEWGFDGVALTDFNQARDTLKAAKAGLDIGMPWGNWETTPFGKPLMEAVENGQVSEAVLDDKVRRILRLMGRVGLLDGKNPHAGGSIDTPEHRAVALRAAEESLVLLKNDGHLLPLDIRKLKRVAVLGPNADRRLCLPLMGGSSGMQTAYEVTPLEGIRKRLAGKAQVEYVDLDMGGAFEPIAQRYWKAIDGRRGVEASYYNDGNDTPVLKRVEPTVNFIWEMGSPDQRKVHIDNFHATFDGTLIPPVTGTYTLRLRSEDTARLSVNILPQIDNAGRGNLQSHTAVIQMQAGREYHIHVDYHAYTGDASLHLEWMLPGEGENALSPEIQAKLRSADAVIFVGGWDHGMDSEGQDRQDMNFPAPQQRVIEQLRALNPRTVVVLMHGSPFTMGWLGSVPAVLDAWYPGVEGGDAIAAALVGDVDPGGKLSFTWPKRLADAPSRAIGTQDHDNVNYKEGVFVGYRYYDTRHVAPEFPFGYGLSYASFRYGQPALAARGGNVRITLPIRDTSKFAGTEIAQLYVAPPAETTPSGVPRPVHELKAFARVALGAHGTGTAALDFSVKNLAYWDPASRKWTVTPGEYVAEIGASSRDIRRRVCFTVGTASDGASANGVKEVSCR